MNTPARRPRKTTESCRKAFRMVLSFVLAVTLMVPVAAWSDEGATRETSKDAIAGETFSGDTSVLEPSALPEENQEEMASYQTSDPNAVKEHETSPLEVVKNDSAQAEGEKSDTPILEPRAELVSSAESDISWYDSSHSTFILTTPQQLAGLAALVNSGNNFAGKMVKLGDDIDLAIYENWVPIGAGSPNSAGEVLAFKGIFDGSGNVISNLKIASDQSYVGLFGSIVSPARVENTTLQNASVTGLSSIGALIGSAYTGAVSNCHIGGLLQIEGNYKVGGLTGGGYATLTSCSVEGAEGSFVRGTYVDPSKGVNLEGDNIGGLLGYIAEGGPVERIVNCQVKNVSVSGTRKVGGMAGYLEYEVFVKGCTVENVKVSCNLTGKPNYLENNTTSSGFGGLIGVVGGKTGTGANAGGIADCSLRGVELNVLGDALGFAQAGYVYGKLRNTPEIKPALSNNFAIDCTGSTIVRDTSAYKGSDGVVAVACIAQGGSFAYYASLQMALNAATEHDTVSLLGDVAENIIVDKANLTLDGKNHVIDGKGGNAITLKTSGAFTVRNATINAKEGNEGRGIEIAEGFSSQVSVMKVSINASRRGISFTDAGKNADGAQASLILENSYVFNSLVQDYDNEAAIGNTRGINLFNVKGAVSINNTEIKGFGYAINVSGTSDPAKEGITDLTGLNIVVTGSKLNGWGIVNLWGSNTVTTISNSQLLAINPSNGSSDSFAAIIVNADIYEQFGGTAATGSVFNLDHTVITNRETGTCSENLFRIDNIETGVLQINFGEEVSFVNTSDQVFSVFYFSTGTPAQWEVFKESGKVTGLENVTAQTRVDDFETALDIYPIASAKNTFLSNGKEVVSYGTFTGYVKGVDYGDAAKSKEKLTLLQKVEYPRAINETNGNAFGGWTLDLNGHLLNVVSWSGDKIIAADSSEAKTGYIQEANGTVWKPNNAEPARFTKVAAEVVVDGKTYNCSTIAEAMQVVSAAPDGEVAIKLLSDVNTSAPLVIPQGKVVTVEGGGKTISGTGTLAKGNGEKNSLFVVSGNLVLNNVNVKSVGIGVRTKGAGSRVQVSGCNMEAQYYALALRNVKQQLVVKDSVLTGWAGIMTSAGDITLSNNTESSIKVNNSTINALPLSDEPYGALVLQEKYHGVTVSMEDTLIYILNKPTSTKKMLAFDVRAYGSTVTAQNVEVIYDTAVTATDAVFGLKQHKDETGEATASSITFSGSLTAPQSTNITTFVSAGSSEDIVRRLAKDNVFINGFTYIPDEQGFGHRTFTANDVSIAKLAYTGNMLTPAITVQAGSEDARVTLTEGTDYSVNIRKKDDLGIATVVNAGGYEAVISGIGLYRGTSVVLDFEVEKGTGNAVAAESSSAVYDGKAHGLTSVAATKEGSTLRFSVDEGATWSEDAPVFTNAGRYFVQVKATNPNYVDTSVVAGEVSVTKASLTIKVSAAQKTYGEADPVFTGVVSGLVDSDDLEIIYGRAHADKNKQSIGSDITITATYMPSDNYQVSVENAKLAIVKAVAWIASEGKTVYYASIPDAVDAASNGDVLTIAHGMYDLVWDDAWCLAIGKSITLQGQAASKVVLRPASAAPQKGSVLGVKSGAVVTLKNIAIDSTSALGGAKAAYAVSVLGGAKLNASLCVFDTAKAVYLASDATASLAKNYWGEGGPSAETYGEVVYPYYRDTAMSTLVDKQNEAHSEASVVGALVDRITGDNPDPISPADAAAVVESLTNASQSTRDEMASRPEQFAKIEEAYTKTKGVTMAQLDDSAIKGSDILDVATVTGAALSAPPSTDPSKKNTAKMVVSSADIPATSLPAGVKMEEIIPLDITLKIVAIGISNRDETILAANAQPIAPLTITMTVQNKWGSNFEKVKVAHYHNDEVSFIKPSSVKPNAGNTELTLTFTLTKLSSLALVAMDEHKITLDKTSLSFADAQESYAEPPAAETVTVTNLGTSLVTLVQPQSTDAFEVGALSTTTLGANGATATFTVRPKQGLAGGENQTMQSYEATISVVIKEDAGAKADLAAKFLVKGKPSAPELLSVRAYQGEFDGLEHAALEITAGKLEGDVYTYSIDNGATFLSEIPVVRDGGVYRVVVRSSNALYADRVVVLDGERAPLVSAADASKVVIDPIDDQTYTGNPLTPEPVVRLGQTVLIAGRDYSVSYRSNINPGVASVIVSGIDARNIEGSQERAFAIEKESELIVQNLDKPDKVNNAEETQGVSKNAGAEQLSTSTKTQLLRTGDKIATTLLVVGGLALLAAAVFAVAALRTRKRSQ